MVEVRISKLWKEFPDGTCIGPIDLHLEDGEMLALLGPSGSGKTTALRMVAGFIKPDNGEILFDNVDVSSLPPNERKIGMVVQSVALFPNMNVFQNIAFGLEVNNWERKDVISRVEELADLLDIRNLLHRRINAISGGEGQRVALARALASKPELLLLDEPLSALDPNLRESLQDEIRKIQKDLRISTIYVTHNQEEAFAIADKIAVLEKGVIRQVGNPSQLYDLPEDEFVASFIGRGSIIHGIVTRRESNRNEVEVGGQSFWIPGNKEVGEQILLSIKPEDVSITTDEKGSLKVIIKSITAQPGRYRIRLDIDNERIYTYISSNAVPNHIKSGALVHILIDSKEIVILSD